MNDYHYNAVETKLFLTLPCFLKKEEYGNRYSCSVILPILNETRIAFLQDGVPCGANIVWSVFFSLTKSQCNLQNADNKDVTQKLLHRSNAEITLDLDLISLALGFQ